MTLDELIDQAVDLRRPIVKTVRDQARGLVLPFYFPAALAAALGAELFAGFTNLVEGAVLDYLVNDGAAPTQYTYLGFSTTTPTETGSNFTEPSGSAYARLSTAAADWAAAVLGDPTVKDNANVLTMPTATGSWGTLTHFGLFAALSGGTTGIWGALDVSKAVGNGDTASFAVGALDLKLGDPADTY